MTIPSDPGGTLDRVRDGVMRVGTSHNPPWVDLHDGQVSGIEVDLLSEFADSLGAEISWVSGGEEALITLLHEEQLDMVIGGLSDETPWKSEVALTRPYAEGRDIAETPAKRVMAVQMGENAFMVELEQFLDGQDISVPEGSEL